MSAVLRDELSAKLPDLVFRPLNEAQLPDVVRIESGVYAFPWSMGNFRDSLFSGYDCQGVWVGDELIGYTIVMPAMEEAHLLNLAVDSRWQGRGIGGRILQQLIDRSRQTTCEVIYLEVRPSNLAALALYDRFGFRQLGLRRDYYPAFTGREDALFLGLNISGQARDAIG